MEGMTFQVILDGSVKDGHDIFESQRKLSNLFKLNENEADKLLMGKPRRIRSKVDLQTARKYKSAIERAGGICKIIKNSDSQAQDEQLPIDKNESYNNGNQGKELIVKNTPQSVSEAARKSDEKYCNACGKIIHSSAGFCPSCGATQASNQTPLPTPNVQQAAIADQKYCNACATPVHFSAVQCPKCGAILEGNNMAMDSPKSKTTAALLAFFLGGVGAHKFYLGSIGMGILYLVFFWTGIPAFVALIEGIVYVTMSDEKFARKVQTGNI
jgi:TM2 domain-containing membrane protein YozV/RNA polymerase subunit RPABC4/transcription elongation factor Spt4